MKCGDLCQLQNELVRWKARWEMMNVTERLNTLDSTIKVFNPDLHIPMYIADVCIDSAVIAMRRLVAFYI